MDYLKEAFGEFKPNSDKDAALKFSLGVLMLDNRVEDLLHLVMGGENFGGVEGEPGWIIERRENGETVGYESWPDNARFRAYVNPASYLLAYPEFYCDTMTFFRYVQAIVAVYVRRHPEHVGVLHKIEEAVQLPP